MSVPEGAHSTLDLSDLISRLRKIRATVAAFDKMMEVDSDPEALGKKLLIIEQQIREYQATVVEKSMNAWLSQTKAEINRRRNEFSSRLFASLEQMLRDRGIVLRGSYPLLTAGLFALDFDFTGGKAEVWYGPKKELLGTTKLSAVEIVKRINTFIRIAEAPELTEEKFRELLDSAYERAKAISKKSGKIPIVSILAEMAMLVQSPSFKSDPTKDKFAGYGRAQFSYHLYKLARGRYQDKLVRLEIAPMSLTRNRANHLWVPTNESGEGHVYAYLSFEEVKE